MKSTTPPKATPHAETKPQDLPQPEMRILRIAECQSLSGKSKLTYQIGCTSSPAKPEIHIRIYKNSAPGFFNSEWIPYKAIQEILDKQPAHRPFTAYVLFPLFRGKSINTPYFLFAALHQEGVLQASKYKKRCYDRSDEKTFLTRTRMLASSAVDLKADSKPQPAKTAISGDRKTRSKSSKK